MIICWNANCPRQFRVDINWHIKNEQLLEILLKHFELINHSWSNELLYLWWFCRSIDSIRIKIYSIPFKQIFVIDWIYKLQWLRIWIYILLVILIKHIINGIAVILYCVLVWRILNGTHGAIRVTIAKRLINMR